MKRASKFFCVMLSVLMLMGTFTACDMLENFSGKANEGVETVVGAESDSQPDGTETTDPNEDSKPNEDTKPNGDDPNNSQPTTPEDEYYVSKQELGAKLISFNMKMRYDGTDQETDRINAIAEFLLEKNADVICLQEVWQGSTYLTKLQTVLGENYEVVYKGMQSGRAEGLVIAYKKNDWQMVSENRFWLSETPEVKSKGWDSESYLICFNMLLEHQSTGVRLNVFNAKLDEVSDTARVGAMRLIMSRIAESRSPVFLGCDFNSANTSEAYKAAAEKLKDCQTVANADMGATYHLDGLVIGGTSTDFLFVSGDRITPETFTICRDKYGENGDLYLSDHYAIQAEVKIGYKVTGTPTLTENGFDSELDLVG